MRGIVILATALVVGGGAAAQEIDWKKIDDTLGRSAAVTADVHRYGFPRTDLNVTLDGVTIKPALALGGWTAFKPVHVREQELLFAAQLKTRGAVVKIVRLPAGPNGEKVGLDDYLVANGPGALRRLMSSSPAFTSSIRLHEPPRPLISRLTATW